MTRENVEYTIITDINDENLSRQVNEMLTVGWMLLGGVACSLSQDEDYFFSYLFAQAMIRNKINGESEEGESNGRKTTD